METTGKAPTAERLLSTLIELYADQMGVKVSYEITTSVGAMKGLDKILGHQQHQT